MARWSGGRVSILTEQDIAFADKIEAGCDRLTAYKEVYPERVGNRTKKQLMKSARDVLNKPQVREYRKELKNKATTAINEAIQKRAEEVFSNICSKEELMSMYSDIARDETETTNNRLRAMDSLAKYLYKLDSKTIDLDANVNNDIIINVIDDMDIEE